MKKQKSYFIVLPKNREVLFASWKIDLSESRKKTSEKIESDADLILEVYSLNNNGRSRIDSIPVHGMENNWHIFTKNEYSGKRIAFSLCYIDRNGTKIEIITSEKIDIPYTEIQSIQGKPSKKKNLYDLTQINLKGFSGSGKNSSW
jgi:hypothetical protein